MDAKQERIGTETIAGGDSSPPERHLRAGKWEPPKIRPLPRLGELTTPTTFSASTPEQHRSDISELLGPPGKPRSV